MSVMLNNQFNLANGFRFSPFVGIAFQYTTAGLRNWFWGVPVEIRLSNLARARNAAWRSWRFPGAILRSWREWQVIEFPRVSSFRIELSIVVLCHFRPIQYYARATQLNEAKYIETHFEKDSFAILFSSDPRKTGVFE